MFRLVLFFMCLGTHTCGSAIFSIIGEKRYYCCTAVKYRHYDRPIVVLGLIDFFSNILFI